MFSDETGRCFKLKLTIIRKSSIMSGGLFSSLFGGIQMKHGVFMASKGQRRELIQI